MGHVKRNVIVCCLVATDVKEFATGRRHALLVSVSATCLAVNMGLAIIRAVILALPVLNDAAGAASTAEIVLFHAVLRVIDVCAITDAQNRSLVVISVQAFVVKTVHRKNFVMSVERVADVILFQTYAEVDPSEDPVFILPCCSMVYTMATLDGTLHMSSYYDTNGTPSGPLPGDYIDTPQCPNCKKPIRGLRRYGRVTKRAAIDAAEKKFITHAQRQLIILQQRVNDAVDRGDLTQDKILHQNLRCFGSMVKRPPCQKVFEACVSLLKKSQGGQGDDNNLDLSTLPVPNSTFRFVGYFNLFSAQIRLLCSRPTASKAETYARQALKQFIDGSYSQQTGEAKLVLVQVLLMQADKMLNESPKSEEERTKREEQVKPLVSEATDLLEDLESSSDWFQSQHTQDFYRLHRSLVSVARRARNSTFYQSVSTNELRAIKTAMQVKLRGSGHWYRCVNGHSYVIGDCGMAMEQTCCPECGAPVGGANHSFVEGTERDMHMDSL
ncbi:Hypothetical protein PHPALM_37110 [Phytophthora palmivora]|uniref:RZ-type domain-containing protein n=1 Tax=Phytophthora palmivora TaxID=4796 RepID=A0A2P4WY91_9STRA|nr:Hypothetical protein PHPALM_37110 [Phytophthora palmivora]